MARSIFREAALERLASPEQLDTLMRVTAPTGWLAFLALVGLLLAALGWSVVGTLPIEVSGRALVMREGGIRTVESVADGQITQLHVQAGDVVEAGQPLAALNDGQTIDAPFAAHILEVRVAEGNIVERGAPVVALERAGEAAATVAVIFLPPDEARQIRPEMRVRLTPLGESGASSLTGQVQSVAEFPTTTPGMHALLGSAELSAWLAGTEARYAVYVTLTPDTAPPTSRVQVGGPRLPPSGTLAHATILVDERRPIEFVLP